MEAEERDSISYPEGSGSGGISREEDPDDDDDDDDVANSGDDVRDTPLEKPLSVLKKKKFKAASVVLENNTIKKKVQVAVEETATQRVQVNAGYENPEILCLGSGCSGVLLKWVLTFYGTEN